MNSLVENPSVLIVGYGNTLRGDDGVGAVVARMIERELDSQDIAVVNPHQLTPELSVLIGKADLVIFIDATVATAPGQVSWEKLLPGNAESESISHFADPRRLLSLTERLFRRRTVAYAMSIGGECWGFSQSLSPCVEAAVPNAIDLVMELIATNGEAQRPKELHHA